MPRGSSPSQQADSKAQFSKAQTLKHSGECPDYNYYSTTTTTATTTTTTTATATAATTTTCTSLLLSAESPDGQETEDERATPEIH